MYVCASTSATSYGPHRHARTHRHKSHTRGEVKAALSGPVGPGKPGSGLAGARSGWHTVFMCMYDYDTPLSPPSRQVRLGHFAPWRRIHLRAGAVPTGGGGCSDRVVGNCAGPPCRRWAAMVRRERVARPGGGHNNCGRTVEGRLSQRASAGLKRRPAGCLGARLKAWVS